jgi:polyhydroxybutyrate depolymerase
MIMKETSILLLLLLGALFSQAQQTIDATISHDGLTREYKLYIPASYTGASAVPLVFNIHGYTSNNVEQLVYGDFRAIADTANFLMVLPQGTIDGAGFTFFNAGFGPGVDDVSFMSALIDEIDANYNINLNRVYSTGMSNGGYMSATLACELSDRFAAIASVTGSITPLSANACNLTHPMPYLQFHGTADATVPYAGSGGSYSIDNLLGMFISANNCDAVPTITNMPDIDPTDGCTAERYEYLNGDDGSEVVHYKIIGGAHTWPGTAINWIGVTNMDIDASVITWEFFNRYQHLVGIDDAQESMAPIASIVGSNLVQDQLQLQVNASESNSIYLFDAQGKRCEQWDVSGESMALDLSNLSSGVYILNVVGPNRAQNLKFIKR